MSVTVENGRDGGIRIFAPVPIGLVAFVPAFISQGYFVCPDVVPMPVEEVCLCDVSGHDYVGHRKVYCVMNTHCHIDVHNDKIIIS